MSWSGVARDERNGAAAPADTAMDRLVRFSERLAGNLDPARLLDDVLEATLAALRADRGWILFVEEGSATVKGSRTLDGGPSPAPGSALTDGLLRRALDARMPLSSEAGGARAPAGAPAALCAPFLHRGDPVGALLVAGPPGLLRFDDADVALFTVLSAHASLLVRHGLLLDALRRENLALREEATTRQFGDLIGAAPGMREVYRRIEKVASTDVSVLLTGETGTGKEVAAREIHRRSQRAEGPFVAVNCGAIPSALLESELFGHVKGAFTGATSDRIGRFQAANGGTLFLDEIGEMPPSLQVKLLRAIQERTVSRVGETRSEAVDIRIISASHRVLEDEIRRGLFREDLYYRLNVVTIRLPPLRERLEDVPVVARFFLQRYAKEFSSKVRGFSPAAIAAMKRHGWPGNIRELENRVKKAIVLAEKVLVGPEDLDLRSGDLAPVRPLAQAKEEFQRRYIDEVLERNGGNRTRTARDLGVDPRTIFRHLERGEDGARKGAAGDDGDPTGGPGTP
jgi:DNA-binding NtrC family response regulator